MRNSEAYLDIVWQQFKKNRFALAALWVLAPLFLLATFAPLIAASQPFVFHDADGQTLYPWFRALFHTPQWVDFAFNMALLGFLPWLVAALAADVWWRRRGVPGRRRLGRATLLYVSLIALLCLVFGFSWSGGESPLTLRPHNKYAGRSFAEELFHAPDTAWALCTPIPFGPTEQDVSSRFKPPMYVKPESQWNKVNDGFPHVFGTDDVGSDALVRMLYGTRISLTVGFVAVGIYLAIGVVLGALAGYFGGWTDMLISRAVEVVMLFPTFFLILTLVALLGPSIYIIMAVIGLTGWTTVARLIRGEVLKQRAMDYVAAARGLGVSHGRIIFRHILPNALSPALVAVPFGIAGAIVTEAGLSLLGFGVRAPTPSWGTLLQLAMGNYSYWWLIIFPSLAIFLTVTVFNLVGNGLRDAMDPRLRV